VLRNTMGFGYHGKINEYIEIRLKTRGGQLRIPVCILMVH
jgi:hypothetical protein